ncbi:MAG: hypothetical protein K1X89_27660 [Myxococcaceae bacterium]|nr:hypothetical protein [Myxococcaceae bacterium]
MAISPAAQRLNRSAHSLSDVQDFAAAAPREAAAYLARVADTLVAVGAAQAASAVKAVLDGEGPLAPRLERHAAALGAVFPRGAEDFAELQRTRASSIGCGAAPRADSQPVRVSGALSRGERGLELRTDAGRVLSLLSSGAHLMGNLPAELASAFIEDGPVVLEGTLGVSGDTFNVEGFALNRDGRYDRFTFGRVARDFESNTVWIRTPRGNVKVADADLAARLAAMPRLGVILPGAPEPMEDPALARLGSLQYRGRAPTFFALGRFMEGALQPADAQAPGPYVPTDMGLSAFSRRPLTVPAEHAARIAKGARFFAEGSPTVGADGSAQRFEAVYVSAGIDERSAPRGEPEADPLTQAVVLTEAW